MAAISTSSAAKAGSAHMARSTGLEAFVQSNEGEADLGYTHSYSLPKSISKV